MFVWLQVTEPELKSTWASKAYNVKSRGIQAWLDPGAQRYNQNYFFSSSFTELLSLVSVKQTLSLHMVTLVT